MEDLYKKMGIDLEKMFGPLTAKDPTPENMVKDTFIKTIVTKENSFVIIAIRCNSDDSVGKRKLTPGVIYNLLSGYAISDDNIKITKEQQNQNFLYDDYFYERIEGIPHVQISAIVGQNGSGKSSIIEYLMRLINNFAAVTIGELQSNAASERLHFIDGIDGDLWYILEDNGYHLKVRNASVKLFLYTDIKEENGIKTFSNEQLLLDNDKDTCCKELLELQPSLGDHDLKELYERFFYTLVSNQSIYAYNTWDYANECNSDEKEALAKGKDSTYKFDIEDKCWLHGLFHKNDAYRTPLVITPYRHEGNIDINNEKDLVIERLVRLYALHVELRTINDHLLVDGLKYKYIPGREYDLKKIKSRLGYVNLTPKGYQSLRDAIIAEWSKNVGKDIKAYKEKPYFQEAVDYLVYKTLKIAFQYKEHHEFYEATCMMTEEYSEPLLAEYIKSLAEDNSHITRKLYQCIGYIIFNVFPLQECVDDKGGKLASENEIKFEALAKQWFLGAEFRDITNLSTFLINLRMQAIVPPPFMQVEITLCEKYNQDQKISFESLSSGEKQQVFSVSSILYHLDNIDSAHKDESNDNRIAYKNVCVVLEEIELYYHPELQQQFIRYFLNGLKQIALEHIDCIHLIIVTHSPYVLSDIPKTNVLALKKDETEPCADLLTFGANIHEMLKDSFFLKGGALGDFAQWEVGHIMACLKVHKWAQCTENKKYCPFMEKEGFEFLKRYTCMDIDDAKSKRDVFSYEHFNMDLSSEILKNRILMIDEPVLYHVLMDEYNRTFPSLIQEQKELKRAELKRQLAELDK